MSALSASVSSLQNVYNAASRNRISGIDQEIRAEKNRDGESSKSVEKIKQLEKKKEAMKKKEFEVNKKLNLANAVISTAAGVAAAIAAGPIGLAIAPLIAAMGLAQIALISGMTYQGGGSSSVSAATPPSSVSLGSRSNVVDVSQRASGGELAYMRGARGVGTNANDFTPAFTGAKYRASGGETAGYVVGEQGPELFVPETPGRIVPNDDIAQAAPVNVTFSVQAIDANSFNDALATQRGNIISMIREAANSYGEGFLETVDTDSLQMER